MQVKQNAIEKDTDLLFRAFWQHMHEGRSKRKSPFHLATLSYITTQHTPQSALVVLRHADATKQTLGFHTDIRQAKVQALRTNPTCNMLFYHPESKTQWRVSGTSQLEHQTQAAKTIWDAIPNLSRICYTQDLPPGTPSQHASTGFSQQQWQNRSHLTQKDYAFDHFCAVMIRLECIEWLQLAHTGHKRHRWQKSSHDGAWQSLWLHP